MSVNFNSFFDYEKSEGLRSVLASKWHQDSAIASKVFDAVAPIAAYHLADVAYRPQAKAGMAKLMKTLGPDFVQDVLFDGSGQSLNDFEPADVRSGAIVEEVPAGNLRELYNQIFAYVSEEMMADDGRKMEFVIDSYGGYNYHLGGEVVFGSDDMNAFPWFDSSAAIKERYESSREPGSKARMGM